MKKRTLIITSLLALPVLAACGNQKAVLINGTEGSIYGEIYGFSKTEVSAGDEISFKVKPSEDFSISNVTNNGVNCEYVTSSEGVYVYKTKIVGGNNKIMAAYTVDAGKDYVASFKMDIADDIFAEIMNPSLTKDKKGLDFRRCGIEQVGAPLKFNGSSKVSSGNFVNYVDGDTTHMETNSLGYTVKMRYLGINTPESTSEIEEWGLTASYYNKFIYSGDETLYTNYLQSSTPTKPTFYGATNVILMSQEFAFHMKDVKKEELYIGGTEEKQTAYKAGVDGYQRNLCYIWYSTVQNPTKNDFRCLNLEMVYQGLSLGIGSLDDMGLTFYKAFDKANKAAEINKRHIFSGERDKNYDYYAERTVGTLSLEKLYKSGTCDDAKIKYYPDSPYCDKRSLYKVHGYVSRKVGAAFYIQDKPSYTAEYLAEHDPYGLYIFTNKNNALQIGDEINVVGALSSYGGTYQMQGISYKDINPDYNRDIEVISHNNKIVPIEVTGLELNQNRYPQVLVSLKDTMWGYNFRVTSGATAGDIGEGGSHEINKYNEAYPFHNTSNDPIFFCSYGETDNAEYVQQNVKSLRYADELVRCRIDDSVLVEYRSEKCFSYQFFQGGTCLFNYHGAEYDNLDDTNPYKADTVTEIYERKKITRYVGISRGYESTGGNKKMELYLTLSTDIDVAKVS